MSDPIIEGRRKLAAEAFAVAGDLRQAAESLKQQAAEYLREADRLEREAEEMLAKPLPPASPEPGGLQSRPMSSTVSGMDLGRNEESRALKISRGRTKGRKVAPELRALQNAGLTPSTAAELCGTTRDVLKQAWGHGKQFRPIRPDWSAKLAKHGVPESTWRKS